MEWLPIATAPKDGTWLLLCGGSTDEYRYDVPTDPPDSFRTVTAFWESESGGWAISFWDGGWRTYYDDPTHWMPLPQAPA